MFQTYYNSVKFLESLSNLPTAQDYMSARQGSVFYLKRSRELVKRLKINLNQFKFIHIAGTSGKGSTVAMLHQIFQTAGKKVGSYYSPHPTTSIERIKVDALYIEPDLFCQLLDKIKPHIETTILKSPYGRPSYFEVFFALALLYFQQTKCEYVVLETGCGGEFDATNIINQPLITAITNVGFDHTNLLGRTLSKIARTKAEIIKPGSIFLTTETRPHLLKIFGQVCQRKKAKFIALNCFNSFNDPRNLPLAPSFARRGNNLSPLAKGRTREVSLPLQRGELGRGYIFNFSLIGQEQHTNARLAYHIAQHLKINRQTILKGLKNTRLSCRFEIIQHEPTVILDGAHNLDKIKSTVNNLEKIKSPPRVAQEPLLLGGAGKENVRSAPIKGRHNKLICIFTIGHNKDIQKVVQLLSPCLDQVLITKHLTMGRKCADLKLLYNLFLKYNQKIKTQIIIDPWQALAQALKQAHPQDLILITGSFYLAGELRQRWVSEEKILRNRKSI